MGCWNGTCAVTNLPILENEEVEVILLRTTDGNPADQSAVTPYLHYLPLPLTFSGTYNDYGDATNCNGPALDIIIDAVRDSLMECWESEDENERYPEAILKEDFDVGKLFQLDHENRLYIKNPVKFYPDSPDYHRLRHIVVRKDVYDGIVNKTKYGRWWDDKFITYAKLDVTEFTKDVDKFLVPVTDGDSEEVMMKRILLHQRGISDSIVGELIGYKNQGLFTMSRPINPIEILTDLRGKNSPLYDDVLDNAIRFAFFNTFMEYARKTYSVPSGVGSQDDTTKAQELCARLTLSSAKAQRKWRKDKYED